MQMIPNIDIVPDGSAEQLLEIPDNPVEVKHSEFKRLAAAEGQELLNKTARPERRMMNDLDALVAFVGLRKLFESISE